MSIMFQKKTKQAAPAVGLNRLVQEIQSTVNGTQLGSHAVAQAALSMESISDTVSTQLNAALQGFNHSLESIASSYGVSAKVTQAQKDAASVAGVLSGDPLSFLRHPSTHAVVATESMSVVSMGVADAFAKRSYGAESYDDKDNRNTQVYSIAYNMQSARQDEFGETFFPTVVVTPDSLGYEVTIRQVQVYDDLHRNVSGALDKFNKRNIIQAMIDHTILKNDMTKIVPVVRAQSVSNFVNPLLIAPRNILLDGESISTAPIAIGKKFSLLGLSQTDTLLANGLQDVTDSIDPAVSLSRVYIKVGDDILGFNTLNLPLATFSPARQGLTRGMNLAFKSTSLMINVNSKNLDGSPLTDLAPVVTGNMIVRLALTLNGDVNLDTADTEIFANALRVETITDNTGALLDLTVAPAAAIVAAIAGGTVLGYDLQAYRSNSNRRQRGQLLDTNYFSQLYPVPLRSPITVPRPVTTDGSTDSSDLAALITATHVRTSNAAVGALIQAANILNEYVDAKDTAGVGPDVVGVGRFLVRPTFFRESIDMLTAVDSITSHQRAADIQAVLVSKIRDIAYRMYRDSGYKAAADAMAGGVAKVPTVVIGTDPVISRYLMVDGDLRTLGSDFDVRVVSTLDKRMAGTIAITFGLFNGETEAAPNALHFGNMAWKPELTVVMPIARGGQISKELTVQPSFLHVVNLPVLAIITVTGIPDVVASKVPVFTRLA